MVKIITKDKSQIQKRDDFPTNLQTLAHTTAINSKAFCNVATSFFNSLQITFSQSLFHKTQIHEYTGACFRIFSCQLFQRFAVCYNICAQQQDDQIHPSMFQRITHNAHKSHDHDWNHHDGGIHAILLHPTKQEIRYFCPVGYTICIVRFYLAAVIRSHDETDQAMRCLESVAQPMNG